MPPSPFSSQLPSMCPTRLSRVYFWDVASSLSHLRPFPSDCSTVTVPNPWLYRLKASAACCDYTGQTLPKSVPSCRAQTNGAEIDMPTLRGTPPELRAWAKQHKTTKPKKIPQTTKTVSAGGSRCHSHAAVPPPAVSPEDDLPRPTSTQLLSPLIRPFLILNCPFVSQCLFQLLMDSYLPFFLPQPRGRELLLPHLSSALPPLPSDCLSGRQFPVPGRSASVWEGVCSCLYPTGARPSGPA